ncbi:MAG: T9SS type A sorting domain-containing protein [Elusimicrobia bacterium]|nr:T9SS type A sorting domain-containing protein [Elusimicrobiota bacterium]
MKPNNLRYPFCFFVFILIYYILFPVCLYAGWVLETVDTTGDVGSHSSITMDSNGYPHISYWDITTNAYANCHLKYAKWDGTSWTIETVFSNGYGRYSSIAIDSNGIPHIAHHYYTSDDLVYSSRTATGWSTSSVDTTGAVGRRGSIAVDSNNNPHISYQYKPAGNYVIKYASWTGTSWSIENVDTTGNDGFVGWDTEIALDSNNIPHIAYYDDGSYTVNYASWTHAGWSTQQVEAVGKRSGFEVLDIAIDSNNIPHISYHDGTSFDLKYASWTGTSWATQTVDSQSDVGRDNCIVIDTTTNVPYISYMENENYELKFTSWTGASWSTHTIDAEGNIGSYTSISLDLNSNPHISYYDFGNDDLKYAKWTLAPDLIVTDISADWASAVAIGGSFKASVSVKNQGDAAVSGSYKIAFYIATSTETAISSAVLVSDVPYGGLVLTPNQEGDVPVTLTVPSSTTKGNYYLCAYIDYDDKIIESGIASNNIYWSSSTISVIGGLSSTLADAYGYPSPFSPSTHGTMTFVNLTADAKIKIYSVAGTFVKEFTPNVNGVATWDGKNDNNESLGAGIYIVHVTDATGDSKIFKIMLLK